MGLQFFPVISRDIWRYKCANHRVTIKKGQDRLMNSCFCFRFFWGDEHDWTSQNPCESWCMLMSCMNSTSRWPMVVLLKILISCFMFEFRTYILYHIVSYSGVLLYWMMMIMVMMVMMMMMVVVVMMMNPLGKYVLTLFSWKILMVHHQLRSDTCSVTLQFANITMEHHKF